MESGANQKEIRIRGARVNNLKSVDIDLPIGKITCFAGPSGSGKTSLAFHTVYNESKRRFLNSFPAYLKFFSDRPAPVDVDEIFPVLPVFGLPQINPVVGTRSVVADTMRLSELFQSLYYHHGIERCPVHNEELRALSLADLLEQSLEGKDENSKFHLVMSRSDFLTHFSKSPFPSRSYDREIRDFRERDPYWEVLRFKKKGVSKLDKKAAEYLDKDIELFLVDEENHISKISAARRKLCPVCQRPGIENKSPANFTAFNALGACKACNGFGANLEYDEKKLVDSDLSVEEGGVKLLEYKRFAHEYENLYRALKEEGVSTEKPIKKLPKRFWDILYKGGGDYRGFQALFDYLDSKRYKASVRIFIRGKQKEVVCPVCGGARISPDVERFYLDDSKSFYDVWGMSVAEARDYFAGFDLRKPPEDFKRALNKTLSVLDAAVGVGLGHLALTRKVKSVSPGEYQRLLLLKHLSYEGTGALFIFDEPSLGLNEKEMDMLWRGFRKLISQGNTVFLVDHSEYFHSRCDRFVVIGPEAGGKGGEVVFNGQYRDYRERNIFHPKITPLKPSKRSWIKVEGASVYGKTFSDFSLAVNEINWVVGPSGSGKSARMVNVLASVLFHAIHGERLDVAPGTAKKISGAQGLEEVIVAASDLARYTSRSTVGSLTGMVSVVRKHFLKTPAAKSMGLKEGHLSPNSSLGQCPSCEGRGVQVVEMQFLEDIVLKCEDCKGLKLKPAYAQLSDGQMTVAEAYSMPVSDLVQNIKLTPKFRRIYEYLKILKLDYLSLDRRVNSLSGGERQRLYLLSKLQKEIYNALIVFENLSFGLSARELQALCLFLQKLTAQNNTIVLIDQNSFYRHVASHKLKF